MGRLLLVAVVSLAAACNSTPPTGNPALRDPTLARETAPESFAVTFDTTVGSFHVACTRAWAPHGVDRFYNLVKIGFFDDIAFFRVVRNPNPFVAQLGIHGVREVNAQWLDATIARDPPTQSNTRGRLTFAMSGKPDTRATQLFFNYGNNANLDRMGFAPICEVTGDGMAVVDKLYAGYGEELTDKQGRIARDGNAYLRKEYPKLDYVKSARIDVPAAAPSAAPAAAPSASAR